MSYLARLKNHLAQNPPTPTPAFEGFEGGHPAHVPGNVLPKDPSEGFEGDQGMCVPASDVAPGGYVFQRKKERRSEYRIEPSKEGGVSLLANPQTHIPQAPSKPSKASGDDPDAFEERAAILEFDGGVDRDKAERSARIAGSVTATRPRQAPAARLAGLRGTPALSPEWIEGALTLSPYVAPCPGFRDGQWVRAYDHLVDFLAGPLAIAAAELGWPTEMLFGVHPTVGIVRVDCCGACTLADRKPIIAVERDVIRFERQTFRRRAAINLSVPVWEFGR